MGKLKTNTIYLLFFIAIVLFYCLFLTRYGIEFWDTGYIPSFSWRIINGQNAYEDFLYKGPPLTLYFHAFFMKILPENGQFLWIRMINYMLFSFGVFFTVTGFYNFFKEIQFNKWAVMSICFVISLLNFPPYPWPTTDGIFFASIAFFILSKTTPTIWNFILIAFFTVLSALTKQSFYPVPILFLAWILFNYNYKKAIVFGLILLGFLSIFLFWISEITTIANFLKQTTGQTKLGMLFYSGFLNYFWLYDYKWIYFAIIIFLSIVLFYFKSKKENSNYKLVLRSLSITILVFSIILCLKNEFQIGSRIAVVSCCFAVLGNLNFNKDFFKLHLTIVLMLGIAWCSSISLGYPFPILFSTGIILSILILFKNELEFLRKIYVLYTVIILLMIIAFSNNFKPYREKTFPNLTVSLNEISPKLIGINTTKYNHDKLVDLKKLVIKYGSDFIVAPNIPMAHYIFNSKSVLPADWIINSEVNKNPKQFIEIAKNTKNIIFLEKSFLQKEELMPEKKENFSVIADYIYKNFKVVDQTKYFIIYKGIEKNEAIPQIN